MLYLAEVQKKSGLLGGGKAELRLLACQRSEQSWSAVQGDEIVPADEASNFSPGALVMVELSGSRQVKRVQEAGRQLVTILQNFSRVQEKSKGQEEEIEQWKQSLTYQSQELNRREMEMETRREQLEQMEEDFANLEQQRQETEVEQAQVQQLQQELNRKTQELEGAWAQLRGEMQKLEERQQSFQDTQGLDRAQAEAIQAEIAQLSAAIAHPTAFLEHATTLDAILTQHQDWLGHQWSQLETQRHEAEPLQAELDQAGQALAAQWQTWPEAIAALTTAQATLASQQAQLAEKELRLHTLTAQQPVYDALCRQVPFLYEQVKADVKVEVDQQALEQMPIDQLQTIVRDLERDLDKVRRFVNEQEEELTLEEQAIQVLAGQLDQDGGDRARLEAELSDERDRYNMLNETLVGQRRNLKERAAVLTAHQRVLNQRQGGTSAGSDDNIEGLIEQLTTLTQTQEQTGQELQSEINGLRESLAALAPAIAQQTADLEQLQTTHAQQQQALQEQQAALSERWGKINLYQELLKPVQDAIDSLRGQLATLQAAATELQSGAAKQTQIIGTMHTLINQATGVQELAAS